MAWKLFRISWLFDPEPFQLLHWETQPSNHGFNGFLLERDSYVELRSTSVVVVTVTVDGVDTTYTLASTAGDRQRVYLPFQTPKGKLFRYQFDAPAAFWIYDFAVQGRGWRWGADATWQVVKPLTGTESPFNIDAVRGPDPRII